MPRVPQWCEEAAINPSFLLVITSVWPSGHNHNRQKGQVFPTSRKKLLHFGSQPERSRMRFIWIRLILRSGLHAVHRQVSFLPTKVIKSERSLSFTTGRRQSRILSSVGTTKVNSLFILACKFYCGHSWARILYPGGGCHSWPLQILEKP